ncbi:hypothetical protein RIEGSTA812A_PEG_524 [invertebrate metagenome]|uniref:Uncharacterized protein n=1 Tax=invertebrate metagenome TaxID=1711999 RepID=A0A484H6L7_9ZZZZ
MTNGQASPTPETDWAHGKLIPYGTGLAAFRPLFVSYLPCP